MIERSHYAMFMHGLMEQCIHQMEEHGEEAGVDAVRHMIMASYEINTEKGRSTAIDVTDYFKEQMGDLWKPFEEMGIVKMEFVSIYLNDQLVAESGNLLGEGGIRLDEIDEKFQALPAKSMRAFAKYTVLAMREHKIVALQKILEDDPGAEVIDGFTKLIREFLDEEMEETVSEFQAKLDRVFGVGDLIPAANWAAPRGEVKNDNLPPPV